MSLRLSEKVEFYLGRLKAGQFETAFHALRDDGEAVVPALVEAWRGEASPDVRAELVRIIWEQRLPSTVPFLATALADPSSEVWKSALDGLVAIATPEAVQSLRDAAVSLSPAQEAAGFRTWLGEAIEQATESAARVRG